MLILPSLRQSSLPSSLRSLSTSNHRPHHHPLQLPLLLSLNKHMEVAEVEEAGEDAEAADYKDHLRCQYQVPQPSIVGRTLRASTIPSDAEPQL